MANSKKKYQLTKEEKGVFITVVEDDSYLGAVKWEQVLQELKWRKISFDAERVKQCFEEATGQKKKISSLSDEQVYIPLFDLQISADKMKAVLRTYPSLEGANFEIEILQRFLQEKGLRYGLKNELFPEIQEGPPFYQEWLIAEGKPSINGQDADLKFNFQTEKQDLKPKELEDGAVDFYDLDLIQIVEAGTVLVEKILPTEGIKGINVLGEELLPKPGKDIRLPLGTNTEMTEADTKLVSKITGHISYIHKKVNVYPTYEVKDNVDFNTGNIKFPGNVIVRGSVLHSFTVEAEGDVEIYGNLGGAVIAEGHLNIKKGIIQGTAEVGGNIYTRYIENGGVLSKESVFVSEAIMHSTVKAGKKVEVGGKRGLIAGGYISAGEEVLAKNIGAPMGTSTILEVGYVPELIDEYKVVTTELKHCTVNLEKYTKLMRMFEKENQEGTLSTQKKQLYPKIIETVEENKKKITELQRRQTELETQFKKLENACIKVSETIYCGVVLKMGKHSLQIFEEDYRVQYRLDDYEIRGFGL